MPITRDEVRDSIGRAGLARKCSIREPDQSRLQQKHHQSYHGTRSSSSHVLQCELITPILTPSLNWPTFSMLGIRKSKRHSVYDVK